MIWVVKEFYSRLGLPDIWWSYEHTEVRGLLFTNHLV